MTDVVVVGAGIAGLTAAWRLRAAGCDVTVLEAAATPGGRMGEARDGEIVFNTGARLIYPFAGPLRALIGELGLADALIAVRDLAARCRIDGDDVRIGLMPGLAALGMKGLTIADRVRLVAFAGWLWAVRGRMDPDDLLSAAGWDGETLAAWADRVLGRRLRARLVDPVFRGTRSWNAEEISPAFFLATLAPMLGRRDVHVLAGGMGRLTAELAARLGVRCASAVAAVASGEGGCSVVLAGGGTLEADVVVLAVPGGAAAGLLADPPAAQTRFLGTVRYNRLGIVHYAIAGDIPPVMRFITPAESSVLSTYQQMAAGGRPHAQLYCQLSPEASREDGPMEPMIREDVRRQFPDLDRRVIGHSEQRIVHKLPVPYPGYLAALAGYRTWQEAAPRRVYLCGDYMGSPLLGGACASGVRAADAVMRHWGG